MDSLRTLVIINGKQVLNFCSNNYLGLANHPRIVKAATEAMQKYGVGPAAVRSIAGTLSLHVELERRMAAFKRVEAAITFQSGFTANGAAIPALVGKEDAIFSDELNHASIIDGSRLSGAKFTVSPMPMWMISSAWSKKPRELIAAVS